MIGAGVCGRAARRAAAAIALLLVAGMWSSPSRAQSAVANAPAGAPAAGAPAARGPRFAVGASFGFLRQADLGGAVVTQFVPSLVGLAYVNIAPRVYLRPGVRLGLPGLSQPDAASDAHVEEHGVQGRAEISVLYDAWVVPALTVGTGLERRSIDFVARGTVQDSGALDRTEWLGSVYAQAGLGVPLMRGFIVIEPYYRRHHTFSDDRSSSELGFDITFSL
jgi:hypothetical protein